MARFGVTFALFVFGGKLIFISFLLVFFNFERISSTLFKHLMLIFSYCFVPDAFMAALVRLTFDLEAAIRAVNYIVFTYRGGTASWTGDCTFQVVSHGCTSISSTGGKVLASHASRAASIAYGASIIDMAMMNLAIAPKNSENVIIGMA